MRRFALVVTLLTLVSAALPLPAMGQAAASLVPAAEGLVPTVESAGPRGAEGLVSEGGSLGSAGASFVPAERAPGGWFAQLPTALRVCDGGGWGGGPATAPAGSIVVPAGDNGGFDFGQANRTYWFAPGVHTLGPVSSARSFRAAAAPISVHPGPLWTACGSTATRSPATPPTCASPSSRSATSAAGWTTTTRA